MLPHNGRESSIEVDQWRFPLHGQTQSNIGTMHGVVTSVVLPDQTARIDLVFVGPSLPLDDRHCSKAQWNFWKNARFEDSFRTQQWNVSSFEIKTFH
jgi:hypothetical protein